jgi:hypothetical protein
MVVKKPERRMGEKGRERRFAKIRGMTFSSMKQPFESLALNGLAGRVRPIEAQQYPQI